MRVTRKSSGRVWRQGRPVAGAEFDVWHSSPVGFYENQDPAQADMNLRGKVITDAEGRFWFRSVKPGFKTLTLRVYADDDPNIETDAQFGVTRRPTAHYHRHDEPHPAAPDVAAPWYSLDCTFVMETSESRLPRPQIK